MNISTNSYKVFNSSSVILDMNLTFGGCPIISFPRTIKKIFENLSANLKSRELRTKFAENALKASKKYDWDVIVDHYLYIMENTLRL